LVYGEPFPEQRLDGWGGWRGYRRTDSESLAQRAL